MSQQSSTQEIIQWEDFVEDFAEVASFQGRLCYCLMSIHAVNPYIFHRFFCWDPTSFLLLNSLYGFAILIATRPGLASINPFTRCIMGVMGSMGFTYASLSYFDWLECALPENLFIRTFLGYLGGRVFLVYLLAFLYHIDTRTVTISELDIDRDPIFEAMYTD